MASEQPRSRAVLDLTAGGVPRLQGCRVSSARRCCASQGRPPAGSIRRPDKPPPRMPSPSLKMTSGSGAVMVRSAFSGVSGGRRGESAGMSSCSPTVEVAAYQSAPDSPRSVCRAWSSNVWVFMRRCGNSGPCRSRRRARVGRGRRSRSSDASSSALISRTPGAEEPWLPAEWPVSTSRLAPDQVRSPTTG